MLWRHAFILGFVLTLGVECFGEKWLGASYDDIPNEDGELLLFKRSPNASNEGKKSPEIKKKKVSKEDHKQSTNTQGSNKAEVSTTASKSHRDKSGKRLEKLAEKKHFSKQATTEHAAKHSTEAVSSETAKSEAEKAESSTKSFVEPSTESEQKAQHTSEAETSTNEAAVQPSQQTAQQGSEQPAQQTAQQSSQPVQQTCQQTAEQLSQQQSQQASEQPSQQSPQQASQQPNQPVCQQAPQQSMQQIGLNQGGQGDHSFHQTYPQCYQSFQQSCQPISQKCLEYAKSLEKKNELWWTLPIPPMDLQEEALEATSKQPGSVCPERIAFVRQQEEILEKQKSQQKLMEQQRLEQQRQREEQQRIEELAKSTQQPSITTPFIAMQQSSESASGTTESAESASSGTSSATESVTSHPVASSHRPHGRTRSPALAAKHGGTKTGHSTGHHKTAVRPQNFLVVSNNQPVGKSKTPSSSEANETHKKKSAEQKKLQKNSESGVRASKSVKRKEKNKPAEEIVDEPIQHMFEDALDVGKDLPVKIEGRL